MPYRAYTRTSLTVSILGALLLPPAYAGDLSNGATATVVAGDAPENWSLTTGSRLNVINGQTLTIYLERGSHLDIDGGTVTSTGTATALFIADASAVIRRATVRSAQGVALQVGRMLAGGAVTGPAPVVTITDSTLSGRSSSAVSVTESASLTLSATNVTTLVSGTTGGGVQNLGGYLAVTNGSRLLGDQHGLSLRNLARYPLEATDGTTLIDGSRVEGTAGNAILVRTDNTPLRPINIIARNGAELIGGNGNLLRVEKASAASVSTPVSLLVESSVQTGNIEVANDGSTLAVALANGGWINGRFDNVMDVGVNDGGHWQLTASSTVGTLALASGGTVALGDGTTLNTLTANTFSGSGGTLRFNTVLGDDASASDRLHVLGDTSGQAWVSIHNIGGAGAQTADGIELIHVDGASNAQFQLAGRAVAGLYEYFLHQGSNGAPTNGSWYLRSALPPPPDPCDVDPTLPQCIPVDPGPGPGPGPGPDPGPDPGPGPGPDPGPGPGPVEPGPGPEAPGPILRPEPGVYAANLRAARTMFRTDYHRRQDGAGSGRAWARVDGERVGVDAIAHQLEIRGNRQTLSVGTDLVGEGMGSRAGVMLSSGNATSTSVSGLTGYWARGKVKGHALGVYGTWRGDAEGAGLYVDGWAHYHQFRNRVEGVGLPAERYDGRGWQGAVETGYAFVLGQKVSLEPQLQVGYTDLTMDEHTEANGAMVRSERDGGLFGRAGLRLSDIHHLGSTSASVQPFLEAHWLYDRNADAIVFDGSIADLHIPTTRVQVGGGASVRLVSGFGAWGGIWVERASGYHATTAQLGMSYRW